MTKRLTGIAGAMREIREMSEEMCRHDPLAIQNRLDLITAVEHIEYSVIERKGILRLAEICTVNYEGCIRLFTDIDIGVKKILVYSGSELDGVYSREDGGEWKVFGFPF